MAGAMVSSTGLLFLALFALQNGTTAIVSQVVMYWRSPVSARTSVLIQEAIVKLPLSAGLYTWECGGVLEMGSSRIPLRNSGIMKSCCIKEFR